MEYFDDTTEQQKVRIVENCILCGEFIMEHEEYYDIKGMAVCRKCKEASLDMKMDGEVDIKGCTCCGEPILKYEWFYDFKSEIKIGEGCINKFKKGD